MIRKILQRLREKRGSAAIEFAIVSPVFLILLIGVVELGYAGFDSMRVQDAAEAGALYAAVHGWDSAGISAAVTNATGATDLTATPAPVQFCGCPSATGIAEISCSTTCAGGAAPSHYIRVSASVPRVTIMTDSIATLPATLTAHSTVRVQ